MSLLPALLLALAALTTHAEPARAAEHHPAAAALRADLLKIVELREQRGWGIDHYEIEGMLPDALLSYCAVPDAQRAEARDWMAEDLRATRAHVGAMQGLDGDALRAAPAVLSASRALGLIAAAAAHAGHCPFTIAQSNGFRGRQFDAEGFTLHAEGGGLASLGSRGGGLRFGGGGAGRLSVGHGLGLRHHVRVGVELGGAALIDEKIRADDVAVDFLLAVPIALRRQWGPYLADVELAALALGNPLSGETVRYGGRAAVLVGVSALRVRSFLPWTGLVVMGEWVAPRGVGAAYWSLRAGIRIGFGWRISNG